MSKSNTPAGLFISFSFVIAIGIGCKPSSVEPEIRGPRIYEWVVDTVAYPGSIQTLMFSVSGTTMEDVYVVGHCDDIRGQVWRYDGNDWNDLLVDATLATDAVHCFSAESVLIVGGKSFPNPNPPPQYLDSGYVFRYSGAGWSELTSSISRRLYSLWGRTSEDVWFGGADGTLLHYNGTVLVRDSLPFLIDLESENTYQITSISGNSGETYVVLSVFNSTLGDNFYLFRNGGLGWAVVDSVFGWRPRIWVSPIGTVYWAGDGLLVGKPGVWESVFMDKGIVSAVFGTSDQNVFAAIDDRTSGDLVGATYHFDGSDWSELDGIRSPGLDMSGGWTDGKGAVVLGYTLGFPQKTVIFRGK